jgi:hypothetical protein
MNQQKAALHLMHRLPDVIWHTSALNAVAEGVWVCARALAQE